MNSIAHVVNPLYAHSRHFFALMEGRHRSDCMVQCRTVAGQGPHESPPRVFGGTVLDREHATRVSIVPSREVLRGSKGELWLYKHRDVRRI
jgi:hypothetical protein